MFYNSTYLHHAMSHADHVTNNAFWIRDKDYTWYSVMWSKLNSHLSSHSHLCYITIRTHEYQWTNEIHTAVPHCLTL